MSKANRKLDSSNIASEYNKYNEQNAVTSRTIRGILLKYGLRGCVAAKKPLLSKRHIDIRYKWAKSFRHWTIDKWRNVYFSE